MLKRKEDLGYNKTGDCVQKMGDYSLFVFVFVHKDYSLFVFVHKDGGLVMLREVGRVGCVRVRVPTKAS